MKEYSQKHSQITASLLLSMLAIPSLSPKGAEEINPVVDISSLTFPKTFSGIEQQEEQKEAIKNIDEKRDNIYREPTSNVGSNLVIPNELVTSNEYKEDATRDKQQSKAVALIQSAIRELKKFFSGHQKDFKDIAITILTALGIVSAVRGNIKAIAYFKNRYKDKKEFQEHQWFDTITCELVVLNNGELKLIPFYTADVSYFLPNKKARDIFLSAAKKAKHNLFSVYQYYPREKAKDNDPIYGLRRSNSLIKRAFEGIFKEGAIAFSMGLPVDNEKYILAPVVNVNHFGKKIARSLSLLVISSSLFKDLDKFKESGDVSNIDLKFLENLKDAFLRTQKETGQVLFPEVNIFLKK